MLPGFVLAVLLQTEMKCIQSFTHVTSKDHLVKGSYDCMGGSSKRYFAIPISLVTIVIVIWEIE